jgi:hypothetical protein
MKRRSLTAVLMSMVLLGALAGTPGVASGDGHFDVWDTAWELPNRSNDAELAPYMQHLSNAGFEGFWISLAPIGGDMLNEPNSDGQTFGSFDNPNPAYFNHIDQILATANQYDLKVGMVVGWAQRYTGLSGAGHHGGTAPLTEANARGYGQFLGNRYGGNPAIGMWVFGGDYYDNNDELTLIPLWTELKAGLTSAGATETTAYHGHHYVQIWSQSFFDIAAPLTGHCASTSQAYDRLTNVNNATNKPVIASEMRYEEFLADWCGDGPVEAGPAEILEDTITAVNAGADGMVYGHDDRWDWAADQGSGLRPLASLGSGGEVLMMGELGYGPGGTPPFAQADSGATAEGGSVSVSVLDNDTYTGEPSVSIVQDPSHGSVAVEGATITYYHDGDESSADSFLYRVADLYGGSTAEVSITVTPVNDPPNANDDWVQVAEGASISIDLAANDDDVDSEVLSVSLVSAPEFGTASLDGTEITYQHSGDEPQDDGVEYEVTDGEFTDRGWLTISVTPTNDPPTMTAPGSLTGDRNTEVVFEVEMSDIDGDFVTLTVEEPDHGDVLVEGSQVTFVPDRGYLGYETLDLAATDGEFEVIAQVVIQIRGVGVADPVLFDPEIGMWHLPDAEPFFFGNPGDTPLLGDWDGDGTDTVGMFRPSNGFVYLRNTNDFGVADIELFYGIAGDVPLVGDWDGDGFDTLAVYRDSRVFVSNELVTGPAELEFFFGVPGDRPFAGDFDGDGYSTIGLYRESTGFAYFRNSLSTGAADLSFFYGEPADRIVAGDWDGDGTETVGVFRPADATFYLSNENRQGMADIAISLGDGNWLPAAGSTG